jgi:hypothetical protein
MGRDPGFVCPVRRSLRGLGQGYWIETLFRGVILLSSGTVSMTIVYESTFAVVSLAMSCTMFWVRISLALRSPLARAEVVRHAARYVILMHYQRAAGPDLTNGSLSNDTISPAVAQPPATAVPEVMRFCTPPFPSSNLSRAPDVL